MLEEEPT